MTDALYRKVTHIDTREVYRRCSDPQHGDSTWDHDCDDGYDKIETPVEHYEKVSEKPPERDNLTKAIEETEKAAKVAGARLRDLWDPEARRYRNPEEVGVLHGIINHLVSVRFALNEMQRNHS